MLAYIMPKRVSIIQFLFIDGLEDGEWLQLFLTDLSRPPCRKTQARLGHCKLENTIADSIRFLLRNDLDQRPRLRIIAAPPRLTGPESRPDVSIAAVNCGHSLSSPVCGARRQWEGVNSGADGPCSWSGHEIEYKERWAGYEKTDCSQGSCIMS